MFLSPILVRMATEQQNNIATPFSIFCDETSCLSYIGIKRNWSRRQRACRLNAEVHIIRLPTASTCILGIADYTAGQRLNTRIHHATQ